MFHRQPLVDELFQRINADVQMVCHKLLVHLFSGRYKALLVDGSGNGYLQTVCDYVHLNLARAKLLTPEQPLREFAWSNVWNDAARRRMHMGMWTHVSNLLAQTPEPINQTKLDLCHW